jgi:hypothetical protein
VPVETSSSLDLFQTGKFAPRARARPTAQPEAIAGNLYSKRPGSEERAEAPPPRRVVAFVAVPQEQAPVANALDPSQPVELAVAFVADGRLVDDPRALLALGGHLAEDTDIRAVLALSWPRLLEAGLGELATQARRDKRRLLLVEVREGGDREGFLVDPVHSTLLARYRRGESGATPTGVPLSLRARLGVAFACLRQ